MTRAMVSALSHIIAQKIASIIHVEKKRSVAVAPTDC